MKDILTFLVLELSEDWDVFNSLAFIYSDTSWASLCPPLAIPSVVLESLHVGQYVIIFLFPFGYSLAFRSIAFCRYPISLEFPSQP